MVLSKKQVLLLAGAVAMAFVLYLLPTKETGKDSLSGGSVISSNSNIPEKDLMEKADSIRDLIEDSADSLSRSRRIGQATDLYKQVLQKNTSNQDAKAGLGYCYTLNGQDPMKGIMMLREVVTANPGNENAQTYLGILSIKSGQYEKAIERFEKVRKINSENINVLLYLGEAYRQAGNRQMAIRVLEEFKKKTKDKELAGQVEEAIKKLQQ